MLTDVEMWIFGGVFAALAALGAKLLQMHGRIVKLEQHRELEEQAKRHNDQVIAQQTSEALLKALAQLKQE